MCFCSFLLCAAPVLFPVSICLEYPSQFDSPVMIALLHLVDLIWVGFHPCFLNLKCIIARLRSSMHSYYFTFFAFFSDFLLKSRFYALFVSI